jgi:hypothetical protein
MSARALLNDLRLIEVPMSYEERIGRSKLSIFRDGIRFLRTIFTGVLCYRPEKIFLTAFVVSLVAIILLAAYPVEYYFHHRHLQDWMIYRFVVCQFLASCALMLLMMTAVVNRMATFGPRRQAANGFWPALVSAVFDGPITVVIVTFLLVMAGLFLYPGIVEFLSSGTVTLHWSRLLAGAFALLSAFNVSLFAIAMKVIAVWRTQHTSSTVGSGDPQMNEAQPNSTLISPRMWSRTPAAQQ